MQVRASLSRHVKSQVRKFMQTYNKQVNSWWYAVKTQDIWNPRHSQDVKLDITANEHISKTSRPTGNRAWRRDHLCTTSMIENVSSVRFRHTWILFFVWFCVNYILFFVSTISWCGSDVFWVLHVQKREAPERAGQSFSHACHSKLGPF